MAVGRILSAVVITAAVAAAAASVGGGAVLPGGAPTAASSTSRARIDLATYPAKRWIVQLKGAPLATYRGSAGGSRSAFAVSTTLSARSRAYVSRLESAQHAFEGRMLRAVPDARVQESYQVVLNGLGVAMSRDQARVVRRMPGVLAVTPDIPYRLDMYSTPAQIGAPTLWAQVGGQSKAGAGVRVAVIDSGIFVRKDSQGHYAGNACFDGAGYTKPGGYPKGDSRFTNNKVIVARAYFRPDDPPTGGDETAIQGPNGDSHGTHTAGTIACNAGTQVDFQGAHVTLTGIAPRAYLMNYRVFYPSATTEDFQNGNAYTVELVKAIDDAVKDGAQVISNSWGASYQNTLAWPDPMVKAAEHAVDSGVTMVFANGNAGPDEGTANSPAISPKVIGVGAVSKNQTLVPGDVSVTAPTPVPSNLTGLGAGAAGFGPQVTTQTGPAPIVAAQTAASNASSLGCSLAGDASPFPAGSLSGDIVLIERGTCEFSEKVFNAQRGGAIAALVYNSAANGDNIQGMGAGAHADDVTIPSWFLRRSDGLNLVAFAAAHPGTAQAKFVYAPHPADNVGDVMAGFSSRGPTQDGLIKPDVVAPGVDVLSAGYGDGPFPAPFLGFGAESGTSMATPHVAGAAALLKQLHPGWKPAQIKSALMTTATENVYLDTAKAHLAGVLDRGAGRIDLTKAGNPGLTLDLPSLSGGDLLPGQSVQLTINATDVTGGSHGWKVTTSQGEGAENFSIAPSTGTLNVPGNHSAALNVTLGADPAAEPGEYEGEVVLANAAVGKTVHVPVWLRVLPQNPAADVLLVDEDGSSADPGFTDYSARYRSLLDSLGVSYDYVDPWNDGFPPFFALYGYKVVLVFTGENDSFDTSGLFTSDQDALAEWLDSGGRLWMTGENLAGETDSNTDFDSTSLGRARLYQGYLGLSEVADSAYDGSAPNPTAVGVGPMVTAPTKANPDPDPLMVDLGLGGNGAGNQDSIEVTKPMADNDTYAAASTMTPLFRPLDSDYSDDPSLAIAWGRSSEPSLEEERQQFRYRSVGMGFGLEAINSNTGFMRPKQVAGLTFDWLLDTITFGDPDNDIPNVTVTQPEHGKGHVNFNVNPFSSAHAKWVRFRWDFGDRSKILTVDKDTRPGDHFYAPTAAKHDYGRGGTFHVRVEALDTLGHVAITKLTVKVHG